MAQSPFKGGSQQSVQDFMGHLRGVLFGGGSERSGTGDMFDLTFAGETLNLFNQRGMGGHD